MTATEPLAVNRPAKIALHHLERWAIVYVRQSHPQQVQRHPESAQVQANLQELALGWGWPRERIKILDGDQGHSGTTTIGRDDFAWLLSEIALGHVGLVLGFQINRLAREDEDCCRLIKICRSFDALMADQDGLYHPVDFNDRLVLTVKGLMGGFELHQLQQRMQAGRLNRVRRGEWLGQLPPGYVIGPDSKLAVRSRRAGAERHPADFRPVRLPGQPQRPVALSATAAHRVALSRAQRPPAGTVALASTPSGDAAQPAASPGLCGRLHLGATPRRSAAAGAGPPWLRPSRDQTRGLCGFPARQSPRLSHLGTIPEQCPSPAPAALARTRSRPGAADRGGARRLGGVRPMRLPHANALREDLALPLPAARLGLRRRCLPEPGR